MEAHKNIHTGEKILPLDVCGKRLIRPGNLKEHTLFILEISRIQGCHGQGKYLENEFFSRSGKSQGVLWMAREI